MLAGAELSRTRNPFCILAHRAMKPPTALSASLSSRPSGRGRRTGWRASGAKHGSGHMGGSAKMQKGFRVRHDCHQRR